MTIPILALVGFIAFLAVTGVRIVKEFERGVVLQLGKYTVAKGPGLTWIIPGVEKMYPVDLRVVARDVPPQDVITKDNVSVKVNAVLYFRVVEPDKAILKVENYLYATSQYAQTSLRSILGQHELDDLLTNREAINQDLQEVIDQHTDAWGIKVTSVELKHVDLPPDMQRAMAKQAEAERERRAKIIAAEGELQASLQLSQAAHQIATAPGAMTLRYLQTLSEIAVENNSTTIFPVPIDLLAGMGNGSMPSITVKPKLGAAELSLSARNDAPSETESAAEATSPTAPASSTDES